ncbi:uncharacterized protein N7477_006776 [Penicillium maclennaniae]|uniref:uncharacterized protein n=1 Tax=Penicillium maclennaniae TaxID=1343394 RepID=UPI00253FCADB|nr:uncharacterized protein N7477_006776 [Penicillium maclennaniae]KAJ5668206.1 hypothetical protein N7477_006776 [Penicillium maclennaniae]
MDHGRRMVDTIECAMSYLYVEDYCVGGPDNIGEQKGEKNDDDRIDCQNWPFNGEESLVSESIVFDEAPSKRPLTPLSRRLQVGLPVETMQTAPAAFANEFHSCDERLGDMALMHAKVYCFAHLYLISKLEDLALQRLTQLLQNCDIPTSPFFCGLQMQSALSMAQRRNRNRRILRGNCYLTEGGDFMIDVSYKLGLRISMHGTSAQSFEGQIDHLEMNIKRLEQEAQDQARLLKRAEEEFQEWESWNRGISKKLRKAKRVVAPSQFSAVRESSA